MKPGFIAPREMLDKKPPHGAPCNNCGLCCVATLCPLAQKVFGHEMGPCPALRFGLAGSKCGLVAEPAHYALRRTLAMGVEKMRAAALLLIGAGHGCDARFNGEPASERFYAELRAMDIRQEAAVKDARKTWGI